MILKRSCFATLAAAAILLAGFASALPSIAREAPKLPPAAVDEKVADDGSETIVLAGGCFWGVQGVFQHVQGVTQALSGYTGGEKATADYETVSTGTTGHAESVRVTFDPHRVSLGRILQIYFSVVHDPTELNRQGPDTGTQYRSAIFPANPAQAEISSAYIAQLNQAHIFDGAIVTKVEPGKTFYPAEDYHQDFLTLHPAYPYIVYNDLPKIEALKIAFPDLYREQPVLITGAPSN
jgi:peptide-methionine (S)-S-oxide reductase